MIERILPIIVSSGFYVTKFEQDSSFKEYLLSCSRPDQRIRNYVNELLSQFNITIKNIHLVFEDIDQIGQEHELHTHLVPCDFQVLIWAESSNYDGRYFRYGTREKLSELRPSFGDICFMKTNDLNFIHGVSPLKSNSFIRTLLISVNHSGNFGEHLTISAKRLKPI